MASACPKLQERMRVRFERFPRFAPTPVDAALEDPVFLHAGSLAALGVATQMVHLDVQRRS
eukprot:3036964-Alexandrium_andersonii.AAC.1